MPQPTQQEIAEKIRDFQRSQRHSGPRIMRARADKEEALGNVATAALLRARAAAFEALPVPPDP